jgi:hypothetical protein
MHDAWWIYVVSAINDDEGEMRRRRYLTPTITL